MGVASCRYVCSISRYFVGKKAMFDNALALCYLLHACLYSMFSQIVNLVVYG